MTPKKIIIISDESQIFEPIKISIFKESSQFKIITKESESLIKALDYYLNPNTKLNKPDLIIFSFNNLDEKDWKNYHEKIEQICIRYTTKAILKLKNRIDILRFTTLKSQFYKAISANDFFRSKSIELINSLLGLQIDSIDSTIISQYNTKTEEKKAPIIDSDKLSLSDKIRTAHLFAKKEIFDSVNVKYNENNIRSYEDEADIIIDEDYKSKNINSIEYFTKIYRNPERITYFLIGHRGSGKSSFIRDFFDNYYSKICPDEPYIIIDFLRFGFVPNDVSIQYSIIDSLFKHLTENISIQKGLKKFYTKIDDLFSFEESLRIIKYYIQIQKINFNDVFSSLERFKFENEIGYASRITIAKEILNKNENIVKEIFKDSFSISDDVNDNKLLQIYTDFSKNEGLQWIWLEEVWRHINKYSKDKPLRFFLHSIIDKINNNTDDFGKTLITNDSKKHFKEWMDLNNSKIEKLAHCNEIELEELINSFFKTAIEAYGKIHLVLDNIDQLDATLSEYNLYKYISNTIRPYSPKLKYTVSMRPSSVDIINEDVAAYKRFWLKTVDLKIVLENRIKFILDNENLKENDITFLETILKTLNYPVALNQKFINDQYKLTDLISQFCGMNLREGKELFAEIIDSWYDNFDKYGKFGFLRKPKNTSYIAEHIAVRSLFLDNTINHKFRNSLVNIFNTPYINGFRGVLIQLRILETLDKYRKIEVNKLYSTLSLLNYNTEHITNAIYHLKEHRLISTKQFVTEINSKDRKTSLYIRHRGISYLEFVKKLSYIQLVYFMTELPNAYSKKFLYPEAPSVNQLDELIDNFLHSIQIYINYERIESSLENITKYENSVRPLISIHSDISEIHLDLNNIHKVRL